MRNTAGRYLVREWLPPIAVFFALFVLAAVSWGKHLRTADLVIHGVLAAIVAVMLYLALRQRRDALIRAEQLSEAADALGSSERRVRDIVEQSPWVVIEHAPDGTIDYANPAAERLYKLKSEAMQGHSPVEWIHPDDVESTMRQIHGRFSGESAPLFQNRNLDNEGNVHYMMWTGVTRYGPRGDPNGSISFGQDVTKEVEAERARERLAAEEQQLIERLWVLNDFARSLRTTLDTTSLYQIAIRAVANVLAGHHCAILLYHREAETFEIATAYSASAGAPALAPEFLRPGARFAASDTALTPAVMNCRQMVIDDLATSGGARERELAALGYRSRAAVPILVDNLCIGLLAALSREPKAQGRDTVEFMQGIAEHLALALTNSRLFGELKSAYNELREAQSQLVQMEKLRAVGEMASGIAHDFNNSLAAVIGYAELLTEEELAPKHRTYVENILKASHDAASTVRRIQQYSRALPEPESFAPVDVNALVREAVTLTRHRWRDQAQNRGVTVDVDMDLTTDLPPVRGNGSELREVFTNLIFNAVDAMPRGGRIRILSDRRDGQIAINVADTGTGMSAAIMEHIFEPFFTTKGREGNGLGLSVSYGIVRRHGGEMRVTSSEGRGTTFEITLPAAESVREPEARSSRNGAGRAVTTLVIDDDPAVNEVVSALLRKLGHTVVTASSGDEGLNLLNESRFDAVITDLGMPGMNGREVALSVKRIAPETAVVLLTGWGDQFRSPEEIPAGVDVVVSKPVRLEQLREALDRAIAAYPAVPATT